MMKIKICGIKRCEDVDILNEFMPDYCGFVFAASSRQISIEQAKILRERLDKKIKTVGVFVNEEPDKIRLLAREKCIDLIQLHGSESDEYIKNLNVDIPIIKAQRVSQKEDIEEYDCPMYLFDTFVKGVYGGTGKRFNWEILKDVQKPFFLAGGINEENIDEALSTNAYCIDVSGGVETNGFKDRDKIKNIIERVRKYDE